MQLLTEDQVDALWRAAGAQPFLAEMCERWLDSEGAARASYDATIRSYVKGSKLASAVGL